VPAWKQPGKCYEGLGVLFDAVEALVAEIGSMGDTPARQSKLAKKKARLEARCGECVKSLTAFICRPTGRESWGENARQSILDAFFSYAIRASPGQSCW